MVGCLTGLGTKVGAIEVGYDKKLTRKRLREDGEQTVDGRLRIKVFRINFRIWIHDRLWLREKSKYDGLLTG